MEIIKAAPAALILSLFATAASGAVSPQESIGQLACLEGAWRCNGHFTANNAAISADITMHVDARVGALVVRHDDETPNAYHALEVWSATSSDAGLKASIVDRYGGMRWFVSDGWSASSLVWTRPADGRPVERFVYTIEAPDVMRVDWLRATPGGALALGDTLTCLKQK